MVSSVPLTTDEEDFLKPVPMPIYRGLFADIQAQGSAVNCSSIADIYADSVAAAYGYAMITDFYDLIDRAIMTAKTIAANNQGAQNPGDKDRCKLQFGSDGLLKIQTIKDRLPPYIRAARQQYATKLTGLLSHKEYASKVQEFNTLVRNALAKTFDEETAARVMRK